jgi:hypothetical protein
VDDGFFRSFYADNGFSVTYMFWSCVTNSVSWRHIYSVKCVPRILNLFEKGRPYKVPRWNFTLHAYLQTSISEQFIFDFLSPVTWRPDVKSSQLTACQR